MKKILFITAFMIFLLSVNSYALNFHADTAFSYLRTWTEPDKAPKTMRSNTFGMFLGLGMTFQRDFTITFGGNFIAGEFVEEDLMPMVKSSEVTIFGFLFELEYVPYIPALLNNRVKWFISFGCGYSDVEMDQESSDPMMYPGGKDGDNGVTLVIQSGLIIQAAQNFAPFVKIGWERIFYMGDWSDFDNNSIVMNVGVRFNFLPTRPINNTY